MPPLFSRMKSYFVNQLLTSARKIGLLRETSDGETEVQEFIFVENAQQIKLFLEDES